MRIRKTGRSYFMNIFLSFLCVIVIFTLFQGLTFKFFQDTIHQETIRYNRMMLRNTSERYEAHFAQVKSMLFNIYRDDAVIGFNHQLRTRPEHAVNYLLAKDVVRNMRNDVYNPLFYLETVILHFRAAGFAIDKDGSSGASEMFSRFYASPQYTYEFWKARDVGANGFQMLPAADFRISSPTGAESRPLLPFVLQLPGDDLQAIALINVRATQHAFFGEESDHKFLILGGEGELLYRSHEDISVETLPANTAEKGYALDGHQYYFAETVGDHVTIMTIVPNDRIASKTTALTYTLLTLTTLSILIGLIVSYGLSRRIHSPIKRMISFMAERRASPLRSNIEEIDFIQGRIGALLAEKEATQAEMAKHKSLVTSYGYISKLKSINADLTEWKDFLSGGESFTVILYELRFRQAAITNPETQPDRIALYLRDRIGLTTSELDPDSHTFQMEKHQILSVVSGNARERIVGMLEELKPILDKDKEYCIVTIAVSAWFEHSSQFNHAYRQVQTMVSQARLIEETQIVLQSRQLPQFGRLAAQPMQDFQSVLQAGDDRACIHWIDRNLKEMNEQEASVSQFVEFAEHIVDDVRHAVERTKIEPGAAWELRPRIERVKLAGTVEEYRSALQALIEASASLIRDKKEQSDPVIDIVLETIREKYAEDLSLEALADKLNMSSAYLSVYIKSKTDLNFSDHLNATRIGKAMELLRDTNLNIQEIAANIGYANITSFNRMFKKSTGLTPSEYRKQHI
ncbi:helix-turn-helix domain-containing protein [Paenibacillus sp. TRM 82003]|nr:helix-turn-helix domain-containing protein [Paenibacillus sp. TRM 82003]